MKRVSLVMFSFMILLLDLNYAQNSEETAVKETLTRLLNYSKEKSFDNASKLIAYIGDDKNREFKTPFDPSKKEELNQVKRICKKISALLDLSSKYEFGKISIINEENQKTYNAEVVFISGEERLITTFKFVKTSTGYLLINLN